MTTLLDTVKEWISGDWGDEDESSETPNPVYCIRGADIVPVINTDYSGIPKRFVSNRTKRNKLLKVGDIIVEKSGGSPTQSTGRTVYISSELVASKQGDIVCSNFCEAFRAKENWDSLYLYYYLQLVYNSGVFFNFEGKTSGLKNLDVKGAFAAIKMPRIDVGDQCKIANVINIIESKIVLNRKKIEKLEALAKTIYDYWFVQFDFPDVNGRPYKSSGGKMVYNPILKREIPDGWEVGNLYSLANYENGLACQKFRPVDGEARLPVVKIREMHDGLSAGTEFVSANIPEKHKLLDGDLLFSWSASLETMIWCGGNAGLNQHIFKVTPKNDFSTGYVYLQLSQYIVNFIKIAEARKTTMGHITADHIERSCVALPSKGMRVSFAEMTDPIFSKCIKARREIRNLTTLRDFLLPLLMNGQVEVGE